MPPPGGALICGDQTAIVAHRWCVAAPYSPMPAKGDPMTALHELTSADTADRLDDQSRSDDHGLRVVEAPNVPADQKVSDAHNSAVGGDPIYIRSDHTPSDAQPPDVAADLAPHSAMAGANSIHRSPSGAQNCGDHGRLGNQSGIVAAPTPPAPANEPLSSRDGVSVLADPVLAIAAEILDDLERVRIANENRLRQLTRTELDEDGVQRGLGIPPDDPMVQATSLLVEATVTLETKAVANLEKRMRKHPLGPWAKGLKGVGDKQMARLLAAIGDPYWNALHDRPRTVAELRSYCGWGDARAQVRRRNEQAKWSDTAKKRTWVIVDSCVKQLREPCKSTRPDGRVWADHVDGCACSPYRVLYDEARKRYEDTVHDVECRRCGPAGKPAQSGSPRSAGHQNAMAYRVMCKALLKDLWREARRLHGVEDDD
jgi:hypothetical protein